MHAQKNKGFRCWMFTYNNPGDDWKGLLPAFKAVYGIAQLERGETGTLHIQGCLYYSEPVRGTHFKDIPCWIKGISAAEFARCCNYSKKQETRVDGPEEWGLRPKSKSKDWESAKKSAIEGRISEIEASIFIPYYTSLKKINGDYALPNATSAPRGYWLFGPPGAGKSYLVRQTYPVIFIKSQSKWWCGYDNQPAVLLDDLDDGGRCLSHYLKIWADEYACYGEVKGGKVALRHEVFYVTSNYSPYQLWKDGDLLQAIVRRFTIFYKRSRSDSPIKWKPSGEVDDLYALYIDPKKNL